MESSETFQKFYWGGCRFKITDNIRLPTQKSIHISAFIIFPLQTIFQQLIYGLKATTWPEFIAVIFGIASVLFSRKEHIWVFPTGIINTVMYTWFCFSWWGLYAEGSLNFYYTIMSIYGWVLWSRKNTDGKQQLPISASDKNEWLMAVAFFAVCWTVLYIILKRYTPSTVPLADAFASAAAYTGMWLMARKKLENWLWWIITNIASVPLYFYKGAVFTSFQYVVFLVLAILGYITWKKKLNNQKDVIEIGEWTI